MHSFSGIILLYLAVPFFTLKVFLHEISSICEGSCIQVTCKSWPKVENNTLSVHFNDIIHVLALYLSILFYYN